MDHHLERACCARLIPQACLDRAKQVLLFSGALLESEAYFLLPVHGWMRRSVILQAAELWSLFSRHLVVVSVVIPVVMRSLCISCRDSM